MPAYSTDLLYHCQAGECGMLDGPLTQGAIDEAGPVATHYRPCRLKLNCQSAQSSRNAMSHLDISSLPSCIRVSAFLALKICRGTPVGIDERAQNVPVAELYIYVVCDRTNTRALLVSGLKPSSCAEQDGVSMYDSVMRIYK